MNSTVECQECGERKHVDFATCLREGWPKHCGYTMRLTRQPRDIEAETRKAIERQMPKSS